MVSFAAICYIKRVIIQSLNPDFTKTVSYNQFYVKYFLRPNCRRFFEQVYEEQVILKVDATPPHFSTSVTSIFKTFRAEQTFLKDEDFSDWIKVKLNIISISEDWILDIKKWNKINISLKEFFITLSTKYPITSNSKNDVVNMIVTQSKFNIPENSFILNFLPYSELFTDDENDNNTLRISKMMFLMEKTSESIFKIKSLFKFSNYKENYTKIKQYFNENLPNYGYPLDNLFKEIESQYKEKFISEIINSSRIPVNQKVYTTLGFKCDNNNPKGTIEIKNIYNNLGLNFDNSTKFPPALHPISNIVLF